MALEVDLTEDAIMAATGLLLVAIVGEGVEVFQAQANRVPEPGGSDYIAMTPMGRTRLGTNVTAWDRQADAPSVTSHAASTNFTVQLDIHGDRGSDLAQAIATLVRDGWGVDILAGTGVTPLWATDGHQAPFVNGEHQWESRWTMELALQVAPVVSTPQDFASKLIVTARPVDRGVEP